MHFLLVYLTVATASTYLIRFILLPEPYLVLQIDFLLRELLASGRMYGLFRPVMIRWTLAPPLRAVRLGCWQFDSLVCVCPLEMSVPSHSELSPPGPGRHLSKVQTPVWTDGFTRAPTPGRGYEPTGLSSGTALLQRDHGILSQRDEKCGSLPC